MKRFLSVITVISMALGSALLGAAVTGCGDSTTQQAMKNSTMSDEGKEASKRKKEKRDEELKELKQNTATPKADK